MRTYLTGLCGAAVLAAAAFAMQAPADAQGQCVNCARVPITKTHTVLKSHNVRSVTRKTVFKDVNRTRYQRHVTRVMSVTRVQPITKLHVVTRVHNRMVTLRQTQHLSKIVRLPPRTETTRSTIFINHPATFGRCCH